MNRRSFLGMLGISLIAVPFVKEINAEELTTLYTVDCAGIYPLSYYTGSKNLNPPRLFCPKHNHDRQNKECISCKDCWSVHRGFPRKHNER
jgi:hypothetical protein